jgi:hypothetical protein
MRVYIKWAFIALTSTFALAGQMSMAGSSETIASLSCVPNTGAGPGAVAGCLAERHTANEIAQCLGIVEGKCMGPNNDLKELPKKVEEAVKAIITGTVFKKLKIK